MRKKNEVKSQEDTTSKTANSEEKKDIRINKYSPSFDKFLKEFGKELDGLKNKKIFVTEKSLIELWDNEYDEQWNKC